MEGSVTYETLVSRLRELTDCPEAAIPSNEALLAIGLAIHRSERFGQDLAGFAEVAFAEE